MNLPPTQRDRIGRQIAASLVAALVLTGALAAVVGGAAAQSSDPAIVLEANEDATTVDLTLTEAPNGLSGYGITLKVAGDSEANITGASYGDEFALTESPSIDNGTEIRLKASDVGKNVQPGATDVHLATVELEDTQKDTEFATLTLNSMDDDTGGRVNPSVRWASQSDGESSSNDNNEESSNNNQESNDSNDDSSDDSDSNDPSSDGGSGNSQDATDSSTTEANSDDTTEESGDDSEATEPDDSDESAEETEVPSTESDGTETASTGADDEQSTTAESGDGFGIIPAVVGLLSLALYVRRTR